MVIPPTTAHPHLLVWWERGLRPEPSPKALPLKTGCKPGCTLKTCLVSAKGGGKKAAGLGTIRLENIGTVEPLKAHSSIPIDNPYSRRKWVTAGQSQQACHCDIGSSQISHCLMELSHASAQNDLSHPLAALVQLLLQGALKSCFMGANNGFASRPSKATLCLEASFHVQSCAALSARTLISLGPTS